jgi:hypothetical protein
MLQKSLEIPKRLTEAVNRRRTENTMATTKRAKEQTVILKSNQGTCNQTTCNKSKCN